MLICANPKQMTTKMPPRVKTAAIGSLLCCALVACKARPPADLVLVKGRIYTSNPAAPWAEAVAIRQGKILLAGTNGQVEKYRGAGTQVIDLGGRMAMPGIIDTHTHFLWGSAGLAGVLLYDAKTVEQVRRDSARLCKGASSGSGEGGREVDFGLELWILPYCRRTAHEGCCWTRLFPTGGGLSVPMDTACG